MKRVTDAMGSVVEFTYDALNNITSVTTNGNEIIFYKYNAKSQLVEEINAAGLSKKYGYDAAGNLTSVKDEDGFNTAYSYDKNNNLASINYADGKNTIYTYNKNGELIEFKDWNGVTSLKRDALSRLKEVTDHNDRVTKYEYDSVGNITSISYPNGSTVGYEYDKGNRLIKVSEPDGGTTKYTYDSVGNILSRASSNGESTIYSYDNLNQTISATELVNNNTRRVNEYAYDNVGNLIYETQTHNETGFDALNYAKTYVYDKAYRLTSATVNNTDFSQYEYDTFGNLIKETENGQGTVFNYNNLNQLISKNIGANTFTYTYDNRGNLTTEIKNGSTQKTYVYDATNHMVKGSNLTTNEESVYVYNGFGSRVRTEQKIINENTKYLNNENSGGNGYGEFVKYLANENLSAVTAGTYEDNFSLTRQTSPTANVYTDYAIDYASRYGRDIMTYETGGYETAYIYGSGGERISQIASITDENRNPNSAIAAESIKKAYIHTNRQDGTAYVTDTQGNMLSYTEYDPWGKITSEIVRDINIAGLDDVCNYTGHNYDLVIDKFYAKARFYDAENRRFTAKDPAGQGSNLYIYCMDNPIRYVDPDGLKIVRIRDYINERSGTVNSNDSTRKSTFILNSRPLILPYEGGTIHGIYVWNLRGYLMAASEELDKYFYPYTAPVWAGGSSGFELPNSSASSSASSSSLSTSSPSTNYFQSPVCEEYEGSGDYVFKGESWLTLAEGSYPYIYSTKDATYSPWTDGFDSSADLTFGTGHSIKTEKEFLELKEYITTHTRTQIEAKVKSVLQDDLSKAVTSVSSFIKNNNVTLEQHQFDAIVSLVFNQPVAMSDGSDLTKALIDRDFSQDTIKKAFTYTLFQGKRIDGLVTRRNNELNLFFTGDYNNYYDSKQKVIDAGIAYISYP